MLHSIMIGKTDNNLIVLFAQVYEIFVNASFLTVTGITVDRFLALHLHINYANVVSSCRILTIIAIIWITSILWGIGLYFLKDSPLTRVIIDTILLAVIFIVNIVLMIRISCTVKVHIATIKSHQMTARQINEGNIKRSVNIMYCILGAFFVCYFPFICIYFVKRFNKHQNKNDSDVIDLLTVVFETILYINSSISPVVYFWRIKEMREAAYRMIECLGRNDKRREKYRIKRCHNAKNDVVYKHTNDNAVNQHDNNVELNHHDNEYDANHHDNEHEVNHHDNKHKVSHHDNKHKVSHHGNGHKVNHHDNENKVYRHVNETEVNHHDNDHEVDKHDNDHEVNHHGNEHEVNHHDNDYEVDNHDNDHEVNHHDNDHEVSHNGKENE